MTEADHADSQSDLRKEHQRLVTLGQVLTSLESVWERKDSQVGIIGEFVRQELPYQGPFDKPASPQGYQGDLIGSSYSITTDENGQPLSLKTYWVNGWSWQAEVDLASGKITVGKRQTPQPGILPPPFKERTITSHS